MTVRLENVFSVLTPCAVFADIGCDHGYITKAMFERNMCQKAIITDISEKSLEKAKILLKEYKDKITSKVTDGFTGLSDFDEALIAGMGGDEICSIINSAVFLPEKLALQPMKNTYKVRKALLLNGYKILRDFTFESGKFYDLIYAEKGEDHYEENEFVYGRENLLKRPEAFINKLKMQAVKLKTRADLQKNGVIYENTLKQILETEKIIYGNK